MQTGSLRVRNGMNYRKGITFCLSLRYMGVKMIHTMRHFRHEAMKKRNAEVSWDLHPTYTQNFHWHSLGLVYPGGKVFDNAIDLCTSAKGDHQLIHPLSFPVL